MTNGIKKKDNEGKRCFNMKKCINDLKFEAFNYNILIIEDSSFMIKIIDNVFNC